MVPVVLLSGGLDSLTLAAEIIKRPQDYMYPRGTVPVLVHFTDDDRDHQHVTRKVVYQQIPFLEKLAKHKAVTLKLFNIRHTGLQVAEPPKQPRGRSVNMDHTARFNGHDAGRQVMFLTVAFSVAASLGSDSIYAAFQMDPWRWKKIRSNPDADVSDDAPKFVKAFNAMAEAGGFIPTQQLYTPFLHRKMRKAQIIKLAEELGVKATDAYWCVHQTPNPCGKCCSCLIWNDAVAELGYDPTNPGTPAGTNDHQSTRTPQRRHGLSCVPRSRKKDL